MVLETLIWRATCQHVQVQNSWCVCPSWSSVPMAPYGLALVGYVITTTTDDLQHTSRGSLLAGNSITVTNATISTGWKGGDTQWSLVQHLNHIQLDRAGEVRTVAGEYHCILTRRAFSGHHSDSPGFACWEHFPRPHPQDPSCAQRVERIPYSGLCCLTNYFLLVLVPGNHLMIEFPKPAGW